MATKPVPEGYHTVTPYLIVKDADVQLKFLKEAFGARMVDETRDGSGRVRHADVLIGDSHVMLGESNDQWRSMPCSIHLYVPDADAVYAAALKAGATSIQEMTTQFYGDRSGGVEDPNGNWWWVSTHVEDVSSEEIQRRMQAMAN